MEITLVAGGTLAIEQAPAANFDLRELANLQRSTHLVSGAVEIIRRHVGAWLRLIGIALPSNRSSVLGVP